MPDKVNSCFSFRNLGAFTWRKIFFFSIKRPFFKNMNTQVVYLNLRVLFYSASRPLLSGNETHFCSCERFQMLVRKTLAQLHPPDVPQASSECIKRRGNVPFGQ